MNVNVMMNMLTLLYFINVILWGGKLFEFYHTGFVGGRNTFRKRISAVILVIWGAILLAVLITRYFYFS